MIVAPIPPSSVPTDDAPPRLAGFAAAQADDDRALLRRWSAGDQSAGGEILGRYKAFFHRCCVRLGVRDEEQMIDCFQDVVLGLVADLPRLAERVVSSFGGFLAWRLRDVVSRRRRAHVAHRTLPEGLAHARGDPATGVAIRDALQRCADKLPALEHRVFSLRIVAGWSVQETADAVRSSANAVSQSLFRASRRLRACLEAAGFTA